MQNSSLKAFIKRVFVPLAFVGLVGLVYMCAGDPKRPGAGNGFVIAFLCLPILLIISLLRMRRSASRRARNGNSK